MGDPHAAHLAAFIRGSRRGFTRAERDERASADGGVLFKIS